MIWSAPTERSGDGALVRSSAFRRFLSPLQDRLKAELQTIQAAVPTSYVFAIAKVRA
jgi:hypothetical protein